MKNWPGICKLKMVKKKARTPLEKKVDELENKWRRALADYLNLEKRVEKEKRIFLKLANAQLLDKLLAVLDELEICARHLPDKGLEIVLKKFEAVLKSEQVEEIKVQGEEFDPETMDAVEIVPGAKNRVMAVVNKGYRLNDQVLRPAKVKVGRGGKKD